MSTAHTPGPWIVDKNPYAAGLDYVVITKFNPQRLTTHLSKSDACLIAAAPEMLEALQFASATGNDEGDGTVSISLETFDEMRAAIAKATGGGK